MNDNNLSSDILMKIISIQTEVVQQGINLSNIMDLVTRRTQQVTEADGASIELIEKNELVYSAASGIAEKYLGLRLKVENSLSGECIKARVPLISNDIEMDDRVNKEACRLIGLQSMIVMPLICGNDVVGVLKVLSTKVSYFNNQSISILEQMSGVVAAAMFTAISNGESELIYKATHDSLTGVSNRALFYDRLRQKLLKASMTHDQFGILALDMDGLKEINDNYGHRAGDAAIREVAMRIKMVSRESDTVSRLGGDEFGVIVSEISERKDILLLIHRIDCEIMKPFEFESKNIYLSASIGYALFNEEANSIDTLLEKADKTMYEEKRIRKGFEKVR